MWMKDQTAKEKLHLYKKQTNNQNPVCVDKASDYKLLRKTSLRLHSSRLQGSNPVSDNCTETRCSALEVKQTQGETAHEVCDLL